MTSQPGPAPKRSSSQAAAMVTKVMAVRMAWSFCGVSHWRARRRPVAGAAGAAGSAAADGPTPTPNCSTRWAMSLMLIRPLS